MCRGSREPCGLKFYEAEIGDVYGGSRLARALWIEISGIKIPAAAIFVEARESLVD